MTNNYFQTQTRESGETYVTMADDCPKWVADVVQDCHDGELPNDWRYETIAAIFDAVETVDYRGEWSDDLVEIVDSLVDCYTSDLYAWATPARWHYIDDARDDCGLSAASFSEQIAAGQEACVQQMVTQVLEAVAENAETVDS